ncbi:Serine/threonine-protein kinase phg2 [Rhizoctonia solani AG-1 IB]|uniref:Serine/threonine-protein kinase phg2 n=1 Tax=Thanatephorus cucumeris (strain AG1-IB / isolate 7/3/14) TaxID=1108050 RepID=M5C6K7_THACB|nr:Serine/threonine-protein kinase phg2 [Rhizoctonia solani AG-1 IB]
MLPSQVHGDLKGANVLIAGDGTPMLADFGSSSLRDTTLQFTRTDTQPGYSLRWTVGTLLLSDEYLNETMAFQAPEIIRGKSGNTTAGDVYSLGMTILEAFTAEVPFPKKSDTSLYGYIVINKKRPHRPREIIPERSVYGNILGSILMGCWSYEPQLRPKATTVWEALKPLTPDMLVEIEEAVDSDEEEEEED